LNITGLKRLCEPAKFEIFAKFLGIQNNFHSMSNYHND
jgi:hypothetical protein